ncbi:MAG: DsbA family oxidoreductase [Alphaproteobacteria bacterium]|nr:DsbA family oxidoreductase [Alphaproteobacteria bacterium]
MLIEIFSDTICPWCFIGKRRLERALAMRQDVKASIRWRPFQLNPWMPGEGMARAEYLRAKFGTSDTGQIYDRIRQVGADEAIDFQFERMRRTPNTLASHRLIAYAERLGRQAELVETLFDGYFTDGQDIGDLDTLAAAATRAGLDGTAARRYLESEADAETIRAEDTAGRRMGIQGVPCFILERAYAISGAQEPQYFLPLFDMALAGVEAAE